MRSPTSMTSRHRWAALALAAVATWITGCGGSSADTAPSNPVAVAGAEPSKPVTVTVWHGNVDEAAATMSKLATAFHALHPDITVKTEQGTPSDGMATKLTTVLGTDSYPDIAYVFGTDVPALSRSAKAVDLTKVVNQPSFSWNDFYPGERATATVGDRVFGVPAVVGNMGVVYNKALFKRAGVPEPTADWSWDDFRATAKKITDPKAKIFGTAYPIAGDEDTVWRFWPMIWQQGAAAISADGTSAPFDDPAYTTALELLRAMAVDDKSMYVDANSDALYALFQSGKIGMIPTGAFVLSDLKTAKMDYGVVPMPAFDGNHETVTGSDNWMVFDNGADRVAAAAQFLAFMTEPKQDAEWSVGLGNMPIRQATQSEPQWTAAATTYPGFQTFADNFANTKHTRPQITAYPAYSLALGEQIAAALTGTSSVADALATAKQNADAALADQATP